MPQCFYTLPSSLEEDRAIWQIEPRLKKHVDLLCQKIYPVEAPVQNRLEAAIARYLFDQFQQVGRVGEWGSGGVGETGVIGDHSQLLKTHWIAFIQRRCEIVARRTVPLVDTYNVSFQDVFMMASEAAIAPAKFLQNFDDNRVQLGYWYPTLITFTDIKIKHLLFAQLRRVTGNNMFGRSNLGVAAQSSRTRVREALEHSGYAASQISQYILAWQCFQEYKDAVNRSVNRFSSADFENIANRYNELNEEENRISGGQIQDWLDKIGEAIRRLSNPSRFRTHIYADSDEEVNLLENIPFETRVDREMEENLRRLKWAIARILNRLSIIPDKQKLFLKYGLELNQTQVGKELGGLNQGTISRHMKKSNESILAQISNWVKQHLEITPTATGLTEIEAVLSCHYGQKFDHLVRKLIRSLDESKWELLKLYYVVQKPLPDIGNILNIPEDRVSENLAAIRQQLCDKTIEQIQLQFQLQLQPDGAAIKGIPELIEARIETLCNLIYSIRGQR